MEGLIQVLILLGGIPLGFCTTGYVLIKIEEYNRVKRQRLTEVAE